MWNVASGVGVMVAVTSAEVVRYAAVAVRFGEADLSGCGVQRVPGVARV